MSSTFTQADLAAINAAIASGELRASVNGRMVEYRSIAELEKAKRHVEAALADAVAAELGQQRPRVRHWTFATLRERL
jgi:roadblock/LC7 domain-containing protein